MHGVCRRDARRQKSDRRSGALGLVARGAVAQAFEGVDAVDQSGAKLGELADRAAFGEAGLPVLAQGEIGPPGFLAGYKNEVADGDGAFAVGNNGGLSGLQAGKPFRIGAGVFGGVGSIPFLGGFGDQVVDCGLGQVNVGGEDLGDSVGELAARFVGVSWGGVVGGFAGGKLVTEGVGIPAGEGEEVGAERPEILVRACGETGLSDGGHDMSVPPGVEGFPGFDKTGSELGVEGFASMEKQGLNLGGFHVAADAAGGLALGWLMAGDGAVGFMGRWHGRIIRRILEIEGCGLLRCPGDWRRF